MSAYPPNRFVQEFAKRTHQNLRDIKAERPISYDDTALVSSLLAVFVLPHERADEPSFLADLLATYEERQLGEIVRVLRSEDDLAEQGGESGPKTIGEIPKFLRHAVAHMNVRPESADGQSLTHLLVWNNLPNKNPDLRKTTFVARIHLARLRSLALFVLDRLSASNVGDKYDGDDPIAKFDREHPSQAGQLN